MSMAGPATGYGEAVEAVEALAARYWDSFLALRPVEATTVGDDRFDDRLEDPSPAGRAAFRHLQAATLSELEAIEETRQPASRRGEGAVTADVLRFVCRANLEIEDSDFALLESIDQADGPQTMLPLLAQAQPLRTGEQLERWRERLAAYGPFIDAHVARIEEASARGVTPARDVAQRVVGQLERMIAEPAARSPLVTRATARGRGARERLVDAVERHVRPANRRLLEAVRRALPASRPGAGLVHVPGGMRMYSARIYRWTSLPADPDELHRRGLEELTAIEDERRAIASAAGQGDDTAAYRRALAADPGNVPASAEVLLGRMRDDLERARSAAPRWFGRLPRAGCEIRALDTSMEADSLGHYIEPTRDGSRPGAFYMNTADLPTRLLTRFATVTYHETIPGHHLQLATEVELDGLSRFRREGASQMCGSYVEGWALYTERLADEMGLFRSAGERFGMLDAQAWRAARLVVDTGIHAFGWERDRAVDFLEAATGFDRADAAIEIDRYIAIPAQALAYKVGQRAIQELRASALAAAGPSFDVRRFHDELLGHGSLPLEVLAAHLPAWLTGADR